MGTSVLFPCLPLRSGGADGEPRRSDDCAALQALGGVLAGLVEPEQVLRTILDQAVAQSRADRGVFVEVSGEGELRYEVLYKMQRADLIGEAGLFSRSIFAEVLRTGEGIIVQDAQNDDRFSAQRSVQEMRLISVLCVPILVAGRTGALVHVESSRYGLFTDEHLGILRSLMEIAGPALEALQRGRELLARHDRLRNSEEMYRIEANASRVLLASEWSFGRFVGRSDAVRCLQSTIQKAATVESPVLLLGETGTGKNILARVLHHSGPRSRSAFVTVFCPSLERGLVEAELFGHRKGAFTGAVSDRSGKVQTAEGGTLFLDEIGELSPEIQSKLLRLLQERTFERVGDTQERQANVRVIAATNQDLDEAVRTGRFRRDLYERLNYIPIRVPPLRARREDIPLLLRHCLDQHESGRWIETASETDDYLVHMDFAWPGNVRHLEQVAARIAMESVRSPVTVADLEGHLGTPVRDPSTLGVEVRVPVSGDVALPEFLALAERQWLEESLRRYASLTRADLAQKLGVSESFLYKRLQLYRLGG